MDLSCLSPRSFPSAPLPGQDRQDKLLGEKGQILLYLCVRLFFCFSLPYD